MTKLHILKLLLCVLNVQAVPLLQHARHSTSGTNALKTSGILRSTIHDTRPSPFDLKTDAHLEHGTASTAAPEQPASRDRLSRRRRQRTRRKNSIIGSEKNGFRVLKANAETPEHNGASETYVGPHGYSSRQEPQYPRARAMAVHEYLVPRQFQPGDKVNMSGWVKEGKPHSFSVTLSHQSAVDPKNMAYQFVADFSKDQVIEKSVKMGSAFEENFRLPIKPGDRWDITMKFEDAEVDDDDSIRAKVTIEMHEAYHSELFLKYNIREIEFITVSGDTLPLQKLSFEFAEGN